MSDAPRPLIVPPPRLAPWRLADRKKVAFYNVFGVLEHALFDAAGSYQKQVYTLDCAPWCNVIAVTPDRRLVLVWQWRFGSEQMSLEVPGGVVDAGEEPIEAARRELLEETGYACDSIEPFFEVFANPPMHGNRLPTFLARGAVPARAPRFDEAEECEVALVSIDDVARLLDEGHVQHALCHPGLSAFARRLPSLGL